MSIKVTHFMRHPQSGVFSVERLFADVRSALAGDFDVLVWKCGYPSRGVLARVADAWAARGAQQCVNHVTGDAHYLSWFLRRQRCVLTVLDLVSLERLRGIKRWLLWLLWYWLPVRRSQVVVTISEATRRALIESARCDPRKVVVIHCPLSREFQFEEKIFDDVVPSLLHIGTSDNKNLCRTAAALTGIRCRLTIIGKLTMDQVACMDECGIEYRSVFNLTRAELVEEYRRADCLVFASTYEGFGLPIIEAQAVGRPVITSDVSSMPEVAGGAACLVDPFDVASIRAGITRVIEDAEYRDRLVRLGRENVKRFQIDTIAAQYGDLYRRVAGMMTRFP